MSSKFKKNRLKIFLGDFFMFYNMFKYRYPLLCKNKLVKVLLKFY